MPDIVNKLERCDYCGDTNVTQHLYNPGMCINCGRMYDNFCYHLNSINALIGAYRCKAAAGYKVPVDIEKYDRLMTLK